MSAYVVLHNTILDREAMMQDYIPKAVETFGSHGVELLVMAEESEVMEGSCEHPSTIILKFGSREQAKAWYNSPEYQAALPVRLGATNGYAVLVDGIEG